MKVATPVEQVSHLSYLFQFSFFGLSATPFLQAHTPLTPSLQRINQSDIASESELFTRYLGSWRDKDEVDRGESFYTFGYVDQDVLKRCGVTEPHYVGIDTTKGIWQFASPSASINGKVIDRGPNTAIADTGTTLASVSDDLCRRIYEAIPGAQFDE